MATGERLAEADERWAIQKFLAWEAQHDAGTVDFSETVPAPAHSVRPTVTIAVRLQMLQQPFSSVPLHDPDIAPNTLTAERAEYGEVLMLRRLRTALAAINPTFLAESIEDALRKVAAADGHSPSVVQNNRHFRRMLMEEVNVE